MQTKENEWREEIAKLKLELQYKENRLAEALKIQETNPKQATFFNTKAGDKLIVRETATVMLGNGVLITTNYVKGSIWEVEYITEYDKYSKGSLAYFATGCCSLEEFDHID